MGAVVIRDIRWLAGVFVARVKRRKWTALLTPPLRIVGVTALRVPYLDTTNFTESFILPNYELKRS